MMLTHTPLINTKKTYFFVPICLISEILYLIFKNITILNKKNEYIQLKGLLKTSNEAFILFS